MSRPLDCPFCGHAPFVDRYTRARIAVSCESPDCYVQPMVTGDTELKATDRWNQRCPDTRDVLTTEATDE